MCLAMLLALAGGCAQWEFDVLAPPEHRGHIARRQPTVVHRQPVDYVLQAADGRLVARIHNRDWRLVTLLGGQSYVVAGDGQTIPLPSRAIAPMGFVKLILPPYPTVYRVAPTFGPGVGFSGGYPHDWDDPCYPPAYLVEVVDATAWQWKGQDTVRLHLVYQHDKATFEHDFSIQKVKVK